MMQEDTPSQTFPQLSLQSRLSEASHENQPLLEQADHNQAYDGSHDSDENYEALHPVVSGTLSPIQIRKNKKINLSIRWPTLIAISFTCFLMVAILLVVFIAPIYVEKYAEEAVSIKPTNIWIDSFSATGIKVQIQADFKVDASKVSDKHVMNIGRLCSWFVKDIEIGRSKAEVILPDYGDILLCIATFPRFVVDIRNGQETSLDFLIDIALKDVNEIQIIISEWLQGSLNRIRILARANIALKSGLLSLRSQPFSKFITLEGKNIPANPHYDVNKFNFYEVSAPAYERYGLALDALILIKNTYPIELDVPTLGFEVLVQGCNAGKLINLLSVTTNSTHIYPNSDVSLEVDGIILELQSPLLQLCPNSDSSPLDEIVDNYIHGNDTTVFIRGSNSPSASIPDWISRILSRTIIPIVIPGHRYRGLIREFSLSDTEFRLPDVFAAPGSEESYPHLSGRIAAVVNIPKEVNFNLNVTKSRAAVDVLHKGKKFGELNLHRWQEVQCKRLEPQNDERVYLMIRTYVNDAPLKITDNDIFTDIVATLLFKRDYVLLGLVAFVDIQVSTALGSFLMKNLTAETEFQVSL